MGPWNAVTDRQIDHNDHVFRLPAGICRVIVVQAENLRDADYLDKSDPYCIVKIGCEERKVSLILAI